MGRTDKGIFITTGRFTSDAKKEASRDGAPPMDLIDGERLCEILKDLELGVKTCMLGSLRWLLSGSLILSYHLLYL